MSQLVCYHFATDSRLFVDASKTSLKAVLLHIGNKLPFCHSPISSFERNIWRLETYIGQNTNYINR